MERFYGSLCSSSGNNNKVQAAWRELLQYTTWHVIAKHLEEIERLPTDKEIRKIVQSLPKAKAPGMDGMTTEVLQSCWSFIGPDCISMIIHFWTSGTLPHKSTTGVMKCIPKKVDTKRLKDWRPLTMLPIVYKVIVKLLSECISPHCKTLISPQQTGFITGQSILENISMAWMMHNWVT